MVLSCVARGFGPNLTKGLALTVFHRHDSAGLKNMMLTQTPDFLVTGHLCHDKVPGGYLPGGAAAYAGLLGVRLGFQTAVLTSFGDDFLFRSKFEAIDIFQVSSPHTTVFENIYESGQRTQFLHRRAAQLSPSNLPENWRNAKTVLLGPICDEVDVEFLQFFDLEKTTLCACPQGWMRQWDETGRVTPKFIENWNLLARASLISMSENDVNGDWNLIEKIAGQANVLVVTQGNMGATVFQNGKQQHFPSFPAYEVDPTGAGDVFAAAFSLHFSLHKNVEKAAVFANAAASLSIEKSGLEGIPDMETVVWRMAG